VNAATRTRKQRIRALKQFQVAVDHGFASLDDFDAAIVAIASGKPADLPEQAEALIAAGTSPLIAFCPGGTDDLLTI
jgi:hypothetical protein